MTEKEDELVAKKVLLEIKGKEVFAVTKAKSPDQSNPDSIELTRYQGIKIDQSVVQSSPEILQHSLDEEACCIKLKGDFLHTYTKQYSTYKMESLGLCLKPI